MNTLWEGIEFTFKWSDTELNNLDMVMVMTDGKLETDIFIETTTPELYLHHKSNHPPQVFKAIIYGQAITVKKFALKVNLWPNIWKPKREISNYRLPT